MHVNVFVPVQTAAFDWNQHLNLARIANAPATDYRYLQFGWGDRKFYTETPSWDQVSPTNALRALFFWHNPSALFVKGHTSVPLSADVTSCVRLDDTNYRKLMVFLDASFQLDAQGHKQRISNGQDGRSGFYAANGYYSILRTCNSWSADALRAANVNTPVWAGLASPIMLHLRNGCSCNSSDP
jgi:uncharacterized protein (TIGR02117 family)